MPNCDADWLRARGARTDRVLLHFPGGAYVVRLPNMERAMLARLCTAANARARIVFYRLAPEHPFPAGHEDCVGAYEQLLELGIAPERIVISGISAGGGMALGVLLAIRDRGLPLPAGAILMSPLTDLTDPHDGSRVSNAARDPVLSHKRGMEMRAMYVARRDREHGSPLCVPGLRRFHRTAAALFPGGQHGDPARRQPPLRRAGAGRGSGGRTRSPGRKCRTDGRDCLSCQNPRARSTIALTSSGSAVHEARCDQEDDRRLAARTSDAADRFMRLLRDDHAGLSRVLREIDAQQSMLRSSPETARPVLGEAMRYLLVYQHSVHHPREDRLFARIRGREPGLYRNMRSLVREHRTGQQQAEALAGELSRATLAQLRGRTGERLAKQLQAYVRHTRAHMRREEAVFYTGSERVLRASDWAALMEGA